MARILLVEPDQLLARTYQTALQRAGHKVDIAASAQAAVDAADAHRPDVVVLELQLADHNGVEFLYEFRSYPEWQKVPVIVQSNVPLNEFKISAATWRQLGVAGYLYKPRTTLSQLLAAVRDVVPVSSRP